MRVPWVWIIVPPVVTALIFPFVAAGGSLWERGTGQSLYADHRARNVGDLVTIVVEEKTKGSTEGKTTTSKTYTIDLAKGTGLLEPLPGLGFKSGSGSSTSRGADLSGDLTARITVVVQEVRANGVLRVGGSRQVLIRGEPYILTISGLVRAVDIRADNTIPSDLVADAQIILNGERPPDPSAKPSPFGWLLAGFLMLLRLLF
ncbi:MAG: flagellar basal body L-ring protein FlgH [Armatimonadota bacterium]|nr:flagellar basal body L-ring protein FlgH [Armatimonadota bacterium]